ncbi:MAG: hypothetical protein MUF54_10255 [Polyangiaceae bacterium]|nr:hypothetical protein [Polyangiaceae bacterium]
MQRLGVHVRSERFDPRVFGDLGGRGGLCRIQGKLTVLVDAHAQVLDRVAVLASAAASIGIENVYVAPAVRQVIEGQMGVQTAPDRWGSQRRVRHLRLLQSMGRQDQRGEKGKAG